MTADGDDIPGDPPESVKDRLLRELQERADKPLHAAALLWTFLEARRLSLGLLTASHQDIVAAATRLPPFGQTQSSDRSLLGTEPLLGAAIFLARIDLDFAGGTWRQPAVRAVGFDGEDVIVAVRRATLAGFDNNPQIPDAQHAPSISTIAPNLTVSRKQHSGLELALLEKEVSHGWSYIDASLERAMSSGALEVHLDPLGSAGLSGWQLSSTEDSCTRGLLLDDQIDDADAVAVAGAAVAAVRAASTETPTILLMPELAATAAAEQAIAEELRAQFADRRRSPLLTIIGLRHRAVENPTSGLDLDLIGESATARHANEAVVLGPEGQELWRHRKMSAATGSVKVASLASSTARVSGDDGGDEEEPVDDARLITEHTVPGGVVTVVPTPMGWTSVVICLDTFANFSFPRLTESPIEVLFVPSLSPNIKRHRDAMQRFVQDRGAIAFVCNRSFETSDDGWMAVESRSFWAMQRSAPIDVALPDPGAHPSFVFRLRDARKRPDETVNNDSGMLGAPRAGTEHTDM